MNVLFDTNVLLDFFLDRPPFSEPATRLLSLAERGEIQGFACATSFTTIFYLARKAVGLSDARKQVKALLSILKVAPVNQKVIEGAIESALNDFEDAVIVESARQVNARVILTRDEKDFTRTPIPAHSPESLLTLLEKVKGSGI